MRLKNWLCFHILNGRLNSVALTRIGEWNCTVWYFCTMRHFNVFSKDAWHSVILQQFYNKQKRYFAERKTKTSGLWILDTGPILEGICIGISDEIRSEAVNLYLLLNKRGKWSKMFWKNFRLLSNVDDISRLKVQILRRIFTVIEQREKYSG